METVTVAVPCAASNTGSLSMTPDLTPATRVSNRPYAYALVGLVLLIVVAWLSQDRIQPVTMGTAAPDFEVEKLDGGLARLSDHSGEVVLLNIWATWCPPCINEMPSIERLHQKFDGTDFEIMAVSVDAQLGLFDKSGYAGGDIQAFAHSLGLTFPIFHNPSGDIQQLYRTTGLPESFLIGRDGVIYKWVASETEWDAPDHTEMIERLLAAPSGGG